tara:strand:+ start:15935 stop:16840 length:906 start_codon:yes stop_codon:yes gene_type:complete
MEYFAGKNGFIWFQGVVEDRKDPDELGRVKVRCLGFHTEDKTELPTEDLPWAYPIQPITSAAMNGIGQTPLGPVEGTWVFGFFRDGESSQEPMILGTLGGVPEEAANTQEGFNDPSGKYPLEDLLNEPDTNKIARGIEEETVVEKKKSDIDKMTLAGGIGGGSEVEEPETPYKAEYPFNHVKQSESGHIEEIDDTPGAERLHTYHKSGTFEEIHPDGKQVIKVVGDKYEAVIKDNNLHVKGNLNITVEGDSTIYTKENCALQVDGDMEQIIGGNLTINAGGEMKLTAASNVIVRGSSIRLN